MNNRLKKDRGRSSKESLVLAKWKKTKTIIGFIYSLVLASLILFTFMTVSFLQMLFSSGEDGKRYCFFDTVYFESLTETDGSIEMSFGLTGEYAPLIIIWCAIVFFLFCVFYISKALLIYRDYLIKERNRSIRD